MTRHGERAPLWARVIGVGLLGLGCFAAPASAQLARLAASANAPKLLVAPFGRDQSADSGLATAAADAVRQRMLMSHTGDFATITKEAVCKALEESGFSCTQPLEPSQIGQLAHLLNARYMVDGMVFPRGADSVLVLARLLQTVRQNPLAASASMVVDRGKGVAAVGSALADRLADKFRSFESITNCRTALEAKDFTKATEAANRALRFDRESGGAYLCLARVLQAGGGSPDSVQAAYEKAHDADSLNTQVGRQLYLIYETKHDTTQMLHMLHHILQVDVSDNDIKKVAVQIEVQRGHPDSAVMILDDALNRNPNQVDLLVLKAISLGVENKFGDAAASMAAAAAVDSAKIDSLFIARTLAFYDAANDSATAFTWRRICTERTPGDPDCWFKYASGLYDRHDTAGAITAIRHLVELRPLTGRGQIVLASWFGAAGQVDSSLAEAKAAVAADSSWRPQAAAIFLRAGYAAFQAKDYPHAIDLLSQAQPGATGQTLATVSYLLGNSQFNIGLAAVQDLQNNPVMKTNSKNPQDLAAACDQLKRATDNFNAAQPNMAAGASVNRDGANQILSYMGDVVPRLNALITRLKCPH
jgi:tetratricopeptide (TPR) repeat protein